MTFLNVNFETQKTTLQSFDRIAKKISNLVDDEKHKKLLWLEVFKSQMKEESNRLKKRKG